MLEGDPLVVLDRHVAGPLEDLVRALGEVGLDPDLLEMCAARIEQMVGIEPPVLARPTDDHRKRVVLAFAEQYVLDAHGVTDELCAELNACLRLRNWPPSPQPCHVRGLGS